MGKFTIEPHALDQLQVMYYGKRIAYCSTKPNRPVCFLRLRPNEDVSDEIKTEAIEYVIEQRGPVQWTRQMEKYRRKDAQPGRLVDQGTQASGDEGGTAGV